MSYLPMKCQVDGNVITDPSSMLSFSSIDNIKLGRPVGGNNGDFTPTGSGQSIYLSDSIRFGVFVWSSADLSSQVSDDSFNAVYVAPSGQSGSSGAWVRSINNKLNIRFFGVDDGGDISSAMNSALTMGLPITLDFEKQYTSSELIASSNSADIDLNGSTVTNIAAGARAFEFRYPYEEIQSISSIDLAGKLITIADTSVYSVGDVIKIVSGDRCAGNRPAEVDGRDYWQSQTVTIDSIAGNVVSVREPFESDYTFSTDPKVMRYSKLSCLIKNGTVNSEAGYLGVRSNGLFSVYGGSNHSIKVNTNLSNATAFRFIGCFNPLYVGNVGVVGLPTDTQGSHGVSFDACVGPTMRNSYGLSCRHLFSNNDTPTLYSDENYYTMGVTYDLMVKNCRSSGDTSAAFATHHGIRRGLISDCTATGGYAGFSIRGRNVTVSNCIADGCQTGVISFSEDDLSELDYTDGVVFDNIQITGTVFQDVRTEKCLTVTISNIESTGTSKRALVAINTKLLKIKSGCSFTSNGEFYVNAGFIVFENSTVYNYGTLNIDNEGMTQNGSNKTIIGLGDGDVNFISYGQIILNADPSYTITTSQDGDFDVYNMTTSFNGFPFGSTPAGAKLCFASKDGSYMSSFIVYTATLSSKLDTRKSYDDAVTVRVISNVSGAEVDEVTSGTKNGQELRVSVTGSESLKLKTLSNFDLKGVDIDVLPNQNYRFFWNGSSWIIDSRTA